MPFPLRDGRSDPSLSDAGLEQARAVAVRLAGERIARLFVTPLRRTHQTAEPLVQATGLAPTAIAELSEVFMGEWEGGEYRLRVAQGDPLAKRIFREERWDVIPGGESPDAFTRRVRHGVEAIVEATGPDSVAAAIVHGAVIGDICARATCGRLFGFVHSENGSLTRLVVQPDGRWLLRSFNETDHLRMRSGPG